MMNSCPACGRMCGDTCYRSTAVEEKPSVDYEGLAELKSRLQEQQVKMYEDMAKNFGGMRIIEAEYIDDNEVALLCGKNAYKEIMNRAKTK